MILNGATSLSIIVGDPIAQVKSPAGMTEALQAAGRNAIVAPVHVAPADLSKLLDGVSPAHNLFSIIVTVPHKFGCYAHCATASKRAHDLGAVNIMRRNTDGGWHGEMLDGAGFVGAVRRGGGVPAGKRALLIGAGGAGSAIGLELLEAGVAELAIHDADAKRRDTLIAKLDALHPGRLTIGSADPRGFALVANASPAGMREGDPLPVDTSGLTPEIFVGCVITAPTITPLIAEARRLGCKTSTGTEMYQTEQQMMLDFLLETEAVA